MSRLQQKTLSWHPTAVATNLGWVEPKTGELLVSIRGLANARKWDRWTNTFDPPLDDTPVPVQEQPKSETKSEVKKPPAKKKAPAKKKTPAKKTPAKKTAVKKKTVTKKAKK